MSDHALNPVVLVQEPDYVGFRKIKLPLSPLGSIYDGCDPYATSLGVVFVVSENGLPREVFVKCRRVEENGKTVYTHDLDEAQYVFARNGFEDSHLKLSDGPVSEESRVLLRAFLNAQNSPQANKKYLIKTRG